MHFIHSNVFLTLYEIKEQDHQKKQMTMTVAKFKVKIIEKIFVQTLVAVTGRFSLNFEPG